MNPGPFYFLPFMNMDKIIEEEKKDITFYSEILSPDLTLLYGNAFKNEYVPYKNYNPTLPLVKDEQEKLLREIQMYSLLTHDLKLYLDIYPEDKQMYDLYHRYVADSHKLADEYQEKYAPLFSYKAEFDDSFTWVKYRMKED